MLSLPLIFVLMFVSIQLLTFWRLLFLPCLCHVTFTFSLSRHVVLLSTAYQQCIACLNVLSSISGPCSVLVTGTFHAVLVTPVSLVFVHTTSPADIWILFICLLYLTILSSWIRVTQLLLATYTKFPCLYHNG